MQQLTEQTKALTLEREIMGIYSRVRKFVEICAKNK